jgi:pilus assembly protein CpaB
MKKIYIIAAFLAIVTGIAAFSLARSLEADARPAEIPTTSVVVTTTEIGEGVFITPEMVQLKAVPTEYAVVGAATTLGDVVGKVNKFRCMAGQQVTLDQLGSVEDASITEGGKLSYTLSSGMRAMTIYVTEITGVAGYINPGDRVDIIFTYDFTAKPYSEESEESGGESGGESGVGNNDIPIESSSMVLENVKVLEAGIITQKLAEAGGAEKTVYTSLTLEVSPEDALKLQFAVTYGQISLLLRAVDDEETVNPPEFTNYDYLDIVDGVLEKILRSGMEVK